MSILSTSLSAGEEGYPVYWTGPISFNAGDHARPAANMLEHIPLHQTSSAIDPFIQPLSSAGVPVQTLANTSHLATEDIFDRLSAQSPIAYIAAAFPIAMAITTFVELVKDFCNFVKACFLGIGRDISNYIQNIIIYLLKLASSLLAPLKFFMDIFNFGSPFLLSVASIVSGVFSVVCFIWQIVRDSIGLYHVQSALHQIDEVMKMDDLSTTEKAARALQYFEEIRSVRERENERVLQNVPDFRQESAEQFLAEHTTIEMEKLFGKHTYERIQKGIECLHQAQEHPEEMLKAIECVREIREKLVSKCIYNWISIATCVCAIAAVALSIAFPPAGAGLTVVTVLIYGLWVVAVTGWVTNGVCSYLSDAACDELRQEEERIASREARTVNYQGQISGVLTVSSDTPFLAEIEQLISRVNTTYIFENESPEERRIKIEKILLSSKEVLKYQELLINKLKEEVFIPFNGLVDHLMELVNNGQENDALGEADNWSDENGRTWRELREKIRIIKSMNATTVSLALRREWVDTFNQTEDRIPFTL